MTKHTPRRRPQPMTVGALRDQLKGLDPDMLILMEGCDCSGWCYSMTTTTSWSDEKDADVPCVSLERDKF